MKRLGQSAFFAAHFRHYIFLIVGRVLSRR